MTDRELVNLFIDHFGDRRDGKVNLSIDFSGQCDPDLLALNVIIDFDYGVEFVTAKDDKDNIYFNVDFYLDKEMSPEGYSKLEELFKSNPGPFSEVELDEFTQDSIAISGEVTRGDFSADYIDKVVDYLTNSTFIKKIKSLAK